MVPPPTAVTSPSTIDAEEIETLAAGGERAADREDGDADQVERVEQHARWLWEMKPSSRAIARDLQFDRLTADPSLRSG